MNAKEALLDEVIDLVIDSCRFHFDGAAELTKEMVLGKATNTNAYMTRVMLAHVIRNKAGFSDDTCNSVFNVAPDADNRYKTIRRWFDKHIELDNGSDAYHVAYKDVRRQYEIIHQRIREEE